MLHIHVVLVVVLSDLARSRCGPATAGTTREHIDSCMIMHVQIHMRALIGEDPAQECNTKHIRGLIITHWQMARGCIFCVMIGVLDCRQYIYQALRAADSVGAQTVEPCWVLVTPLTAHHLPLVILSFCNPFNGLAL